ncbi:MAG TPA: malto-oligosyltrehalose synthase [Thermodesulfobacteriota bacterium]|nr:malto-oligosyltrehalose synthase [Thermodesulfobacteriota bacterium]
MRIPVSTYRLQFNENFRFTDAQTIISYLNELGIGDLYASPIFKAQRGSTHGYDVTDPLSFNPEIGAEEEFETMVKELKGYNMGLLLDIVPNHMAYSSDNYMLMDVLENGRCSEYFDFFDIEWNHAYESIRGRILTPFLGKLYGDSLEEGEITLEYESDGFTVNYYDLKLPIKIESYASIITHRLNTLKKRLGEDHPDFIKLLGILYSLKNLPSPLEGAETQNLTSLQERRNQIRFIKRMLWELYQQNGGIKKFVDENVKIFNGEKGNPESFNLLHNLLSEQNFRLSFWKVVTEELNYRRFFTINQLISLRVEDERVFNHIHSFVFKLINEGKITGLRIDHIDGLYDPTNYLKRLRGRARDTYIVVEKILELPEEDLPRIWEAQGTTGYEYLNYVNGIFCRSNHEKEFDKIYSNFIGFNMSYEELTHDKKKLIIERHMTGDVDNLAHLLKRILSKYRQGSDITLYGLKRAIIEVLASFPVYRTYINYENIEERDRVYIRESVEKARNKNPDLELELNFLEKFLLLEFGEYASKEEIKDQIHFVMRFQQFTGPLMAKGFEDTALYIHNRLISLNDVGGNPSKFGISTEEFHDFNRKKVKLWPHSINTTSTHDTKRGEDVRARINVLSEIPEEWRKGTKKWSRLNEKKKVTLNGRGVPDRNDEYFLYQTLIGAFPFFEDEYSTFVDRIKEYMIKAVREAKIHTAWLKPDTNYEDACVSFVDKMLKPTKQNRFLKDFIPFERKIAHYGIFNSLSQALIKITSPGVPDLYRGTELWDLSLVDPDNRRPVDFGKRKEFLGYIKEREKNDTLGLIEELLSTKEDGRLKLFLIYKSLRARHDRKETFEKGDYIPLEVKGKCREHIIAFARRKKRGFAITVAPRFLTSLIKEGEYPLGKNVWRDTYISVPEDFPSTWEDVITAQTIEGGETLQIAEILKHFPVALLISEGR